MESPQGLYRSAKGQTAKRVALLVWDKGGQGGKYCAIGHAEDNECDNPKTIDTWTSGEYKAHEYKECKEGYPVKIVTFNGQHTCDMSWAPKMTWDFINQF